MNTFRVRCLVALNWDRPEAMNARICVIPSDSDSVVVARRDSPFPTIKAGDVIPEILQPVTDLLVMQRLSFRSSEDLSYVTGHFDIQVAYHDHSNTIYLADRGVHS